ncbi:hypothetical protein [Polaribacter sp.]|uniref:hypothetical protein n=1 Tax=Polaribacter sp. TaxID=1920175 RepID=UPI003EF7D424
MKTNKLDNNIKEKFAKRTFEPSASAWQRLSDKLDEQPKQKKKGWFFYIGIAASVLVIVALAIQFLSSDNESVQLNKIIVDTPVDTINLDKKIDKFINENKIEKAVVKVDEVEEKAVVKKNVIAKQKVIAVRQSVLKNENSSSKIAEKEQVLISKNEVKSNLIKEEIQPAKNEIKPLKRDSNSSIKIDSEDLLYAVTHSSQEVKNYYAKYNITREDVLKTIQNQLIESNLKVNPNSILAEVERTIIDDDFQNNFMKSLKQKVTNIATAIASRNN